MDLENREIELGRLVFSNGLILEKIFSFLPFRQYLLCRRVSRTWDDAVRIQLCSRARIDLSMCTMVKKTDDKKKSEIEEKLDLIQYFRISELHIGIEDGIHPVVAEAFKEVGVHLTKLTIKAALERNEDFQAFSTIMMSSPNIKELVWWGMMNQNFCHHYNTVFPSVEKLDLGFYAGEVENMGNIAVTWISSTFPNIRSLSCLPHHREGLVRYILRAWSEGSTIFSRLKELTVHFKMEEETRLLPLLNLPAGLKVLNLSVNGKRETGSVHEFMEEDGAVLTALLNREAPTLEKLIINFLNLWKPKPLVQVTLPELPKLKYFTVTSDFMGDLCIDFLPSPGALFPNLVCLNLPYLCGEALNRFMLSGDKWVCRRLRFVDFKLRDKLDGPWMKTRDCEWGQKLEVNCAEFFPNAELVDIVLLQNWISDNARPKL